MFAQWIPGLGNEWPRASMNTARLPLERQSGPRDGPPLYKNNSIPSLQLTPPNFRLAPHPMLFLEAEGLPCLPRESPTQATEEGSGEGGAVDHFW
jgi:hypothetical protein